MSKERMMDILDDLGKIKKIDKSNALGSIEAFPEQLEEAWEETRKIKAPPGFQKAKNIVLTGMGGSALGGRIAKSLWEKELKVPLVINTEYQLPFFVDQKSLVIVASYSGNTEETLSSLEEALRKKAMVFAYTTNGQLGKRVQKGEFPGLIFSPTKNPLGYPKTAIGYAIGLVLGILSRLGYAHLTNKELGKSLKEFKRIKIKKTAKRMAKNLDQKIGVLIASEHLKGAVHAFSNQVNEIAHSNSFYFNLPEMNHHLVEAFASPQKAQKHLAYYFFSSDLYHPRVKKRYPITREILQEQGIANFEYLLKSKTVLAQVFELVNLGGYVAFYLSVLKGEDPGPEPWIIYLKKKLKKK